MKMSRSHPLPALAALILLVLAVFAGRGTADIHLRDMYFVRSMRKALMTLAGFSGLVFLACIGLRGRLRSARLGWIHGLGSVLLLAAMVILLYQSVYRPGNFNPEHTYGIENRSKWLLYTSYILLAFQILVPGNLLISGITTRRNGTGR